MVEIEQVDKEQATRLLDSLVELLQDSVDHGASVGFLPPLSDDEAREYWQSVIADIARGVRVLVVAQDGEQVVGTAQIDLPSKPNARHRAEVQKLLVHTAARRQGIARRLMAEIERIAQTKRRHLLVLDTRADGTAEELYRRIGYIEAGRIPNYAQNAEGGLDTTILFYRNLPLDG